MEVAAERRKRSAFERAPARGRELGQTEAAPCGGLDRSPVAVSMFMKDEGAIGLHNTLEPTCDAVTPSRHQVRAAGTSAFRRDRNR
jgi:hypothetical protein